MRRIVLGLAGLSLTFSLACGDSGDSGVIGRVDQNLDETNKQVNIICGCYVDLAYKTKGECLTEQGEILPSAKQCIYDAFNRDESAGSANLDCALPVEKSYTDCLNKHLVCKDARNSIAACDKDYMIGDQRCEDMHPLPNTIKRDIQTCLGSGSSN